MDTYQAERHPVGKAVLRSSGGIVRLAIAKYPWTLALRSAFTTIIDDVGAVAAKAAASRMRRWLAGPRGSHALVGTRVPDVTLKGGRLYEALRGGRFVLVAPTAVVRAYGLDDLKGRKDRLAVESWASDRRTTLLVRPDGYVGLGRRIPRRGGRRAGVGGGAGRGSAFELTLPGAEVTQDRHRCVGRNNVSRFDTMRDGEGRVVLVSKDGKVLVPTNYRYRP